MAMTKDDVLKYGKELAQASGLAPEVQEGFLKALEHEGFAGKLGEAVMRQSDYSRSQDALKKEREAFDSDKSQWKDWYTKSLQQFEAQDAALKSYRETYGDPPVNGKPLIDSPVSDFISKKDFDAWKQSYEANTISVIETANQVSFDHYKRFGEPLDMPAFKKFALESNLPLAVAYERFIAPKLTEREKMEREAAIKAAKEEGRKEALAEHKIPVDTAPRDTRPSFFDRLKAQKDAPKTEGERAASFREEWQNWRPPAPPQS